MGTYTDTNFRSYTSKSIADLHRLFDVIGLPRRISVPILRLYDGWLIKNGPEWTTARLKALKVLFLQHYGGNKAFRLDKSEGIACHNDGSPHGPFRALWTMGSSYRMVNRIVTVLQAYTGIVIQGAPTWKQLKKFLEAVESPRPSDVLPEWCLDQRLRDAYSLLWNEVSYDTIERWTCSEKNVLWPMLEPPTVKRKGVMVKEDTLSIPESSIAIDDHKALFLLLNDALLEEFESLINKSLGPHRFPDRWRAVRSSMLGFVERRILGSGTNLEAIFEWSRLAPVVGKIGFIQERGCKLRAVANPFRIVQVVLSRLHNWLSLATHRILPWDCTQNQEKGVLWARQKLRQGIKVYSFDLSNASDTIPLEDQIAFLRYVGPKSSEFHRLVDFFEVVSRSQWVIKTLPNAPARPLVWTKGQGLGIVCSFGAFSQTHGARLHQLSRDLELQDGQFVVLGDDVMVTEHLAEAYHKFVVKTWGCDISEGKSISSEFLAEFASRLITPGRMISSYKYPKSKRLFSVWNPLELPRKYGKKAIKLVPSRFRLMVQVATTLPKPQGLGWKPESDALMPDSKGFESILVPNKDEQLSDVAYVTKVQRLHAQVTSFEVRSRRKVDRYLDVEVAYASSVNLGNLYGKFSRIYRTYLDVEDFAPDLPLAAVEFQWFVLHRNENLKNKDLDPNLSLYGEEKKKEFPNVDSQRTSPFEVVRGPKNPMKVLLQNVFHWVRHIYGFGGKSLKEFKSTRFSRAKSFKSNK